MRKLSIIVLIAVLSAAVALSGCGGGGGGGGSKSGGGGGGGATIVTGTVVDGRPGRTGGPFANVTITMGPKTAVTGSDGRFTFDLGGQAVYQLFPSAAQAYFEVAPPVVDDPLNPPGAPTVTVSYNGFEYTQDMASSVLVPLPLQAYLASGVTVDLGTITVLASP